MAALAINLLTSHNLIIPTPGPVEVANNMKISMGIFTIYALMVGLPMVLIGGWLFGLFIGRKETGIAEEDIPEEVEAATEKQPSGFLSFFVLLLPIALILFGSIMALILEKGTERIISFHLLAIKISLCSSASLWHLSC